MIILDVFDLKMFPVPYSGFENPFLKGL